jgi:hypothetical protein
MARHSASPKPVPGTLSSVQRALQRGVHGILRGAERGVRATRARSVRARSMRWLVVASARQSGEQ